MPMGDPRNFQRGRQRRDLSWGFWLEIGGGSLCTSPTSSWRNYPRKHLVISNEIWPKSWDKSRNQPPVGDSHNLQLGGLGGALPHRWLVLTIICRGEIVLRWTRCQTCCTITANGLFTRQHECIMASVVNEWCELWPRFCINRHVYKLILTT